MCNSCISARYKNPSIQLEYHPVSVLAYSLSHPQPCRLRRGAGHRSGLNLRVPSLNSDTHNFGTLPLLRRSKGASCATCPKQIRAGITIAKRVACAQNSLIPHSRLSIYSISLLIASREISTSFHHLPRAPGRCRVFAAHLCFYFC